VISLAVSLGGAGPPAIWALFRCHPRFSLHVAPTESASRGRSPIRRNELVKQHVSAGDGQVFTAVAGSETSFVQFVVYFLEARSAPTGQCHGGAAHEVECSDAALLGRVSNLTNFTK